MTEKGNRSRRDRLWWSLYRRTVEACRRLLEWRPMPRPALSYQQVVSLPRAVKSLPMRGNHDGGKILFGPDGKLYVQIGDNGRRGQLQNLASGPFGPGQPDDQFGGPAPDDAHLTGAIFRLNWNGSAPADNPFAGVTVPQMAQFEQQAGVSLTAAQ